MDYRVADIQGHFQDDKQALPELTFQAWHGLNGIIAACQRTKRGLLVITVDLHASTMTEQEEPMHGFHIVAPKPVHRIDETPNTEEPG